MAYNEQLAGRIREALAGTTGVEEQAKMGGISFMVAGKMCVRAHSNGEMMLRCDPARTEELLLKKGAARFEMKGKPAMKGWLLVGTEGTRNKKDFDNWIGIALSYTEKIASKKKK
jgi:TfoX N-terminal domain